MANIKSTNTEYYNSKIARAKQLASTYRSQDKMKNFDVSNNITHDDLLLAFSDECVYCGETNWRKLGFDRIDNSKGHTKDNVVCCCSDCNWFRSSRFTTEEMLIIGEAIRKIKEKRSQKPN